ncbi:GntR family transcriptional regulator [Acrocarpospora pleiomorpha]|uniref:GntR family transcriptional regulator n=1 Tax=Acrocarpospora pleiomorpha TaxID=90975 RepID=A0A5M3XB52_9ACTN|nr:GntR family transcriptional regulator [Acrocarpospora pleiomorpha]GES18384.1 GntR family transcriptional regulator [Acrocarpospora pleiomorpha]
MSEPNSSDAYEETRPIRVRSSTAEWAAAILRQRVTQGGLLPGSRLIEDELAAELEVSRNTLREAFRLLGHERLLEHKLNRGVYVRVLSPADVADIYRVRRLIEGAAVRRPDKDPLSLAALRDAVSAAETAAANDRWFDVGTADLRYHQIIASLNGSRRLNTMMSQLLAELRLVFHAMDPHALHAPFLPRNRELLTLLESGQDTEAEHLLATYLNEAERLLLSAYAQTTTG